MKKQFTQENGENTNNIQADTINIKRANIQHLPYSEIKQICIDVVNCEMQKFTTEARRTAIARQDKFFTEIYSLIVEMKNNYDEILSVFNDPDMQYILHLAQTGYIRKGNDNTLSFLTELIANRIKEVNESLTQVCLNEAIEMLPKLIPKHFNILSIIFVLNSFIDDEVKDDLSLIRHFEKYLKTFIFHDMHYSTHFEHLSSAKCGNETAGSITFGDIIARNYTGLFLHPFTDDEMKIDKKLNKIFTNHPELFVKCVNSPQGYQFNIMYRFDMKKNKELDNNTQNIIEQYIRKKRFNKVEAEEKVIRLCPWMKDVIDRISHSSFNNFVLSSIGNIFAILNINLKTSENLNIKNWIEDERKL